MANPDENQKRIEQLKAEGSKPPSWRADQSVGALDRFLPLVPPEAVPELEKKLKDLNALVKVQMQKPVYRMPRIDPQTRERSYPRDPTDEMIRARDTVKQLLDDYYLKKMMFIDYYSIRK